MSDVNGEEKSLKNTTIPEDTVSIIRRKWDKVAELWDEAYKSSNFREHKDGLAPRISEVGLITGAVLHVLPSLEKAVQFMPQSQRSLRVMRVEVSDSGQRIVGIKFPMKKEAIVRLRDGMKEVANARQGSLNSSSYNDEAPSPTDKKAMAWATAERKTVKSFFGAAASKAPSKSRDSTNKIIGSGCGSDFGCVSKPGKRKEFTSNVSPASHNNEKWQESMPSKGSGTKKKKTASISSFFQKKNKY